MDPRSRGREVARDVQRSSLKPGKRPIFCHRRGIENFCRLFGTQQRPNVFVSDARPAPATYHRSFCNTVTRARVGAPNERAPFRFHGAVVGFVARYLSRTRNLAASNIWLSPRSAQELFFSGFLKSLKLFFRRFVLIASGTEIFWRVSLKFQLFMETSRFHCHRSYTAFYGSRKLRKK